MRESRMYGSEGGAANTVPTPIKGLQESFNISKKPCKGDTLIDRSFKTGDNAKKKSPSPTSFSRCIYIKRTQRLYLSSSIVGETYHGFFRRFNTGIRANKTHQKNDPASLLKRLKKQCVSVLNGALISIVSVFLLTY